MITNIIQHSTDDASFESKTMVSTLLLKSRQLAKCNTVDFCIARIFLPLYILYFLCMYVLTFPTLVFIQSVKSYPYFPVFHLILLLKCPLQLLLQQNVVGGDVGEIFEDFETIIINSSYKIHHHEFIYRLLIYAS